MFKIVKQKDLSLFPHNIYEESNDINIPSKLIQEAPYSYRVYAQKNDDIFIEVKGDLELFKSEIPYTEPTRVEGFRDTTTGEFVDLREIETNNIKVQVGEKIFDGDEVSQTRMTRALLGLGDNEVIGWKLADNTFANVSKLELTTALRLAGELQTQIWVKYA